MFFQQGLLAGLAQAQTQALPPPSPMYPALYYHQTSDPSVFGQFHAPAAPNTNNTAAVHQTYGNGYMAQPMVQSQHSQIPAEYVHAQQQPSYQPYQWPLSNAGSANTKADD